MDVEVDPGKLPERVKAVRAKVEGNLVRMESAQTRLLTLIEEESCARSERDKTHESVLQRLQARLESQPVVEQAKGIVMAQVGCDPDKASALLRRAARQAGVEMSAVASDLVRRTTQHPQQLRRRPPHR